MDFEGEERAIVRRKTYPVCQSMECTRDRTAIKKIRKDKTYNGNQCPDCKHFLKWDVPGAQTQRVGLKGKLRRRNA